MARHGIVQVADDAPARHDVAVKENSHLSNAVRQSAVVGLVSSDDGKMIMHVTYDGTRAVLELPAVDTVADPEESARLELHRLLSALEKWHQQNGKVNWTYKDRSAAYNSSTL